MYIINMEEFKFCVFFSIDDPCPQPEPIKASDLYPCTQATSMSFFDNGSKAGFGITVVVLFLFPVGKHGLFLLCAVL